MSQENVELVRRLYAEEPRGLPAVSPLDERVPLDRLFRDYYDEQLEIRMPGGRRWEWKQLPSDRLHLLTLSESAAIPQPRRAR